MRRLAFVAAALLLLVPGAPLRATTAPAVLAKGGLAVRPYVLDQRTWHVLRPLNPLTLRYGASAAAPILLPGVHAGLSGWMAASDNGAFFATTAFRSHSLAVTDYEPANMTIHVIDAATGAQTARFHPALPLLLDGITDDGSQVYGPVVDNQTGITDIWAALSSIDGRVIHEVHMKVQEDAQFRYDPAAGRLYVFAPVWGGFDSTTPQSPSLDSYDVTSGRLLRHLTLVGVMAGSWNTGRQVGGGPIIDSWQPGIALSPDGRQIAVMDAAGNRLTVVDTGSMRVSRTDDITRPQGFLERVAGWLGVIPAPALAKALEGGAVAASYAADGRSLYVTGTTAQLDDQGRRTWTGLGIERIDVATGQVEAAALPGEEASLLSTGSAVYVLSSPVSTNTVLFTLYRLAPDSLAILAKHVFRRNHDPLIYVLASGV